MVKQLKMNLRIMRGAQLAAVTVVLRFSLVFFFQAEDGIRDYKVTGVQTCALPICDTAALVEKSGQSVDERCSITDPKQKSVLSREDHLGRAADIGVHHGSSERHEIGRASCRERV